MPISKLLDRVDGSAGRVKANARAVVNLATQISAEEWNNVAGAVVELLYEVGLPGGITAGSVLERIVGLETMASFRTPSDATPQPSARAGAPGALVTYSRADHVHSNAVRASRNVSTATAALTAADEVVSVSYTGATCTLTLPLATGHNDFLVKRTATSATSIVLAPADASAGIEGGSAGASYTVPNSNAITRPAMYIFSDGTNWWVA